MSDGTRRRIALILFPNVGELDAIGPWEVLSHWTSRYPEDGWDLHSVSRDGAPTPCAKGLTIVPQYARDAAPTADVILHPGGQGTRPLLADEDHLDWVRRLSKEATLTTSVCTGALVLAKAGLLRGRPVTTHRTSLDLLAELEPTARVDREARFIDDGDLVTSAGVSAGIDMALHLVAKLHTVERARQVRYGIQYDPEPPV
ncbi:DJ-1/PfpI family protein [Kitasatospora sp. NPDC093806]|uniref:DJ-1/PfpI family protein n=1 Tax=Kitasatospora sp. NPDC093806 TaxID=3155075 RepID=UPI00342F9239